MKFWVGVLATLLVVSPIPVVITEYETIIKIVEVKPEWKETPVIDSLMDEGWEEESQRQSDCLFEYLRQQLGYEITLEAVLYAGAWLDILGGPCEVIGGEDGSRGLE